MHVAGCNPASPACSCRTQRGSASRERMAEAAVVLSPEQRAAVEEKIRAHCRIRGWTLHALKVRSNHVHVVLTCSCAGAKARDELKLWGSRCLSELAGLTAPVARKAGRKHWWTEGGDVRTIESEEYLANAVEYVEDRQGD